MLLHSVIFPFFPLFLSKRRSEPAWIEEIREARPETWFFMVLVEFCFMEKINDSKVSWVCGLRKERIRIEFKVKSCLICDSSMANEGDIFVSYFSYLFWARYLIFGFLISVFTFTCSLDLPSHFVMLEFDQLFSLYTVLYYIYCEVSIQDSSSWWNEHCCLVAIFVHSSLRKISKG